MQLQNAIKEITDLKTETKRALEQIKDQQNSNLTKMNERLDRKRKIDQVSFNNAGNQNQYDHCKEVLEKMEEVEEAFQENRTEDAKKSLEAGKKIVNFRMKLIKIADREGWGTVRHFVADDLVSGDEEEKRLKKAIRANLASREAQKKPKTSSNQEKTSRYFERNREPSSPRRYHSASSSNHEDYFRKKMEGIVCFNCRYTGHYASDCPYPSSRDSNLKVPKSQKDRDGN